MYLSIHPIEKQISYIYFFFNFYIANMFSNISYNLHGRCNEDRAVIPSFLWGFKPNYMVAASALQVLRAATISEYLHCS